MTGVFAVDPGVEHTGWAILTLDPRRRGMATEYHVKHVDHGVITTNPKQSLEKRLLAIFTEMRGMFHNRPETYLFVAVEEYFIGPNRKSAALVLQAKGAMLAACAAANIPVRAYNPVTIKKELTERGNAKKAEVRAAVIELLQPGDLSTEHEADALATAVTAIRNMSAADRERLLKQDGRKGLS